MIVERCWFGLDLSLYRISLVTSLEVELNPMRLQMGRKLLLRLVTTGLITGERMIRQHQALRRLDPDDEEKT